MKELLTEWRKYLNEKRKPFAERFPKDFTIAKFSRDHGAQGVMWFAEDKDKIIGGESGALSSKYIMKVELAVDKTAGWEEYDKLYLQQIEDEGYDSIQLDDNWIMFDPKRVKVIGVEERK